MSVNKDAFRPTILNKVKDVVFSIIHEKVKNAIVLDLFSGSGAVALEALSRGAEKAYLVETDKYALIAICHNLRLVSNYELIVEDFDRALKKFAESGLSFDIIFVDPPHSSSFGFEALCLIDEYNLLKDKGIVVFETGSKKSLPIVSNYYILTDSRLCGKARLLFLEKKG